MRCKTLAVLLPVAMLSGTVVGAGDLVEIRSLREAGKSGEALAQVRRHLEKAGGDPEAMFLQGLLLAEGQQEEQAMEVFEDIVDLRPDRPEPLNNLAVIQAARGDYEQALDTLKEALRTHPAYRTAYENLTRIYGQLASEAYSRALSVDQARTRNSVELVLLSEMVLPETRAVEMAAPTEIAASTNFADSMPLETEAEAFEEVEPETALAEAVGESEEVAAEPEIADPKPMETEPEASEEVEPETALAEALGESEEAAVEPLGPEGSPEEAIAAALAEEAVMEAEEEIADPAPAELEIAAPGLGELADVVEAWARAWSEQRVDDYLYFYGTDFLPAEDMAREDWEALRRERVARPEFVKVSVAFLDFENRSADQALVRFNQSFESDTFSDVVTKTLEFAREGGEWKIVKESVDT